MKAKRYIRINPDYRHLTQEIGMILSGFESRGELLYAGRNCLKAYRCSDGTELVVKRFGRLNLLRRLVYSTVCRSKARRAYDYGLRFQKLGVETPTPVAYAESYVGGVLREAYFVSLRTHARPLFGEMVESEHFDRETARQVASLMWRLHSEGAMHGDPNLANILRGEGPGGKPRLEVIDTNRSHFGRRLSRRVRLANLMRVTHRRDLSRFISGEYARLAGLDPERTADEVEQMLGRFERNRALRHRIKRWFAKR